VRARRLIRAAGWGVLALAGPALTLVVAGQVVTGRAMRRQRAVAPAPLVVRHDGAGAAARVARGRRLVEVVSRCGECHGDDLGGKVLADDALLGRLAAANLTGGRGGVGRNRTDADLARAIRHGVGPGGRPLVVMPSDVYSAFDDADLGAIVAYLRAVPPVDRELPPTRVGPMTGVLYMAGLFPLFAADAMDGTGAAGTAGRVTPPAAATPEYGAHLATVAGCRGCHGSELGGDGAHGAPGAPKAPNLTSGGALAGWREADFVRAIRTGRRPDGSAIGEAMPWKYMGGLTDEELRALWLYSRSVPPRQMAIK
jgi:cytochrome c553